MNLEHGLRQVETDGDSLHVDDPLMRFVLQRSRYGTSSQKRASSPHQNSICLFTTTCEEWGSLILQINILERPLHNAFGNNSPN